MKTGTENRIKQAALSIILASSLNCAAENALLGTVGKFLSGDVATKTSQAPKADRQQRPAGKLITIAVADVEDQRIANLNLKTMLESQLSQSGLFDVLNRTSVGAVFSEQGFAQSGAAIRNSGLAQSGQMKVARYLAEVEVLGIEDDQAKQGIGYQNSKFGIGLANQKASISIDLKVTDSTTGSVLHRNITGKANKQGIAIKIAGINAADQRKAPLEQAAMDLIAQVVDYLGQELVASDTAVAQSAVPVKVVKVNETSGILVLEGGSAQGTTVGQRFSIAGEKDEFGFATPGSESIVEVIAVNETHAQCKLVNGPLPAAQTTAQLVSAN